MFCCELILPISVKVNSLALQCSCDRVSASEGTPDEYDPMYHMLTQELMIKPQKQQIMCTC